jgi:hypothetical protein
LEEVDALLPLLADLANQTRAFTKTVEERAAAAEAAAKRAARAADETKGIIESSQVSSVEWQCPESTVCTDGTKSSPLPTCLKVRSLVKEALSLMADAAASRSFSSRLEDPAHWQPVPLVGLAVLNGQRSVAEMLVGLSDSQASELVASVGEGESGERLLEWLLASSVGKLDFGDDVGRTWRRLMRRIGGCVKDVNAEVDGEGRSALMLLARHGAPPSESNEEGLLAQLLLDHGASCLATDREGSTALALASATGRLAVARALVFHLKQRAAATTVGHQLAGALVAACAGGQAAMAAWLVDEVGVDVNTVDPDDRCSVVAVATMAACVEMPPLNQIPRALGQRVSPFKHVSRSDYESPFDSADREHLGDALQRSIERDAQNQYPNTKPLRIVQWLLEMGADPTVGGDFLFPPLIELVHGLGLPSLPSTH